MALDRHVHMIVGSAIDDMTLTDTGTPAESTMPVTNLQNQYRGRPMRRTGTAMTVKGNRSTVDYASAFALAWHNLPGDGDYRLRLYDGEDQTGNEVYDSTVLTVATPIPLDVWRMDVDPLDATYEQQSIHPSIAALFFSPVLYKSFQLDINAPGATDFDIGRLFLGNAFRPLINYDFGSPFKTIDPSEHVRTGGSSLITVRRNAYRQAEIDLRHLDRGERERLSYEENRLGKSPQIFLALDPGETGLLRIEQMLIGKRLNDVEMTRRNADYYEHKLIVSE